MTTSVGIGRRIALATRGHRGGVFDRYHVDQVISILDPLYTATVTADPSNLEAAITVRSDNTTFNIDSILVGEYAVVATTPQYKVELTYISEDSTITILDGVP